MAHPRGRPTGRSFRVCGWRGCLRTASCLSHAPARDEHAVTHLADKCRQNRAQISARLRADLALQRLASGAESGLTVTFEAVVGSSAIGRRGRQATLRQSSPAAACRQRVGAEELRMTTSARLCPSVQASSSACLHLSSLCVRAAVHRVAPAPGNDRRGLPQAAPPASVRAWFPRYAERRFHRPVSNQALNAYALRMMTTVVRSDA